MTASSTDIVTIGISEIDDSQRLRPVDPDHAELIAASIMERGLLTPLRVRHNGKHGWILIAGAHRLAALKMLKWTELTVGEHVIIADVSDVEAQIDEIDENLARHELNALDRAVFLFKRKKLFLEALDGKVRGGDRRSQKFLEKIKDRPTVFETNFAASTAKRVGLSKTVINDAIRLAEKIEEIRQVDPEVIAALRGTAIEGNQKELFAFVGLEPEQRRDVAQSIKRKAAKSVAAAQLLLGFAEAPTVDDPQQRLYASLCEAWGKADKATRKQFLAFAGLVHAAPAKAAKE